MDISCTVKILILVNLMNLSMFDVDASFHTSNSTKSSQWGETQPIHTTSPTKAVPVKIEATTTATTATIATTVQTEPTTTTTETSTDATIKNEISTTLSTTAEHKPKPDAYKHDEHEHKLMFYISVGVGSAFVTLLFSLIVVLARRYIRKKKENKKRVVYWAKINRACQSQYIPNEEVSTNNPMYEGSRSRTTSNVLYGVPEQEEDITSKFSRKNDYVLSPPTQQSPKPDLVISNACALYQNTDDLYSEPGKVPEGVEGGNYERIKSFIQNGNSEVRVSTGSYAEPCILFNGIFISENTGYVSAVHKTK